MLLVLPQRQLFFKSLAEVALVLSYIPVRTLCRLVTLFCRKPTASSSETPGTLRNYIPKTLPYATRFMFTVVVTVLCAPNHQNRFTVIVTAPEGHLVSGGSDNRLILWEAQQDGKVKQPQHILLILFLTPCHLFKQLVKQVHAPWRNVWFLSIIMAILSEVISIMIWQHIG